MEQFLEDQNMPLLEDLSVSYFRPHILIPTLGRKAPGLKYLTLADTAPSSIPQDPAPDDVHALRQLLLDAHDIPLSFDEHVIHSGSSGLKKEGTLHLNQTWDGEGKESAECIGKGTFESDVDRMDG